MVKFGPAGNSEIFYKDGFKNSLDAPLWLKNHNLDLYEYSFGRMFNLKHETAKELGKRAKECGIEITVHSPYYINLANPSEDTIQKNANYILTSLSYLRDFQGKKLVVHTGSCGKLTRIEALNNAKKQLDYILKKVYENGYEDMFICLETMGKSLQLGTVDEVLELCKMDKMLMPTFDFGHINAFTQGSIKSEKDYRDILEKCQRELGEFKTKNCHVHFSKIEYSSKGEIRHLTLEDTKYGPEFEPLAVVIKQMQLSPTIICESKDKMMEDAMELKKIFNNLLGGK